MGLLTKKFGHIEKSLIWKSAKNKKVYTVIIPNDVVEYCFV